MHQGAALRYRSEVTPHSPPKPDPALAHIGVEDFEAIGVTESAGKRNWRGAPAETGALGI